jgi:hydroxymethylbilane synthase
MGYEHMIAEFLNFDEFTPAVGQGSVAVEVHTSLPSEKKHLVRQALNHIPTEKCLLAERAFLKTMEGGCSIPVFGMATLKDQEITLTGGITSLDGQKMIKKVVKGHESACHDLGNKLAKEVLSSGGKEILASIQSELSN